jgi:hypothetical protein
MKITRANWEDGAYLRGVSWEVFSIGVESEHHDAEEIEKIDSVGHRDVDLALLDQYGNNPWFENDHEAELMVCFLAYEGDRDAIEALHEIGCTRRDVPWLGAA